MDSFNLPRGPSGGREPSDPVDSAADLAPSTGPQPVPPPADHHVPVWLQRAWMVTFVIVCIEVGMLMVVLPWTPVWRNNLLMMRFPAMREFLMLGFVRGIISGLGLVDIWIGVWEAVSYKDLR